MLGGISRYALTLSYLGDQSAPATSTTHTPRSRVHVSIIFHALASQPCSNNNNSVRLSSIFSGLCENPTFTCSPNKKKKICILTNTRQTLLYDADGLFIHCSNMREFATTASTVSTRNEPYHEAIHPVACAIDRSANHTQLAKMSFDDEISTLKLRCPFVNLCKNKKTWHHL